MPNIPSAGSLFAPWTTLSTDYDPEIFRSMIYSHPNSERVRWFKAMEGRSFSKTTPNGSSSSSGKPNYEYSEQTQTRENRVLIQGFRVAKNYVKEGDIQVSDIVITAMGDEFQFAPHDYVIPIGRVDGITGTPDARLVPFLDTTVRGKNKIQLTGTVTNSGSTVIGSGTSFTTNFQVGSIIGVGNTGYRVTSIVSDTSLIIESTPSTSWNSNRYYFMNELLEYNPAAYIDSIIDSNGVVYDSTLFTVSSDETAIVWLSATNSPAFGVNYSVRYYSYPRFEILPDVGTRRHVVNGTALPITVICRMMTAQSYSPLPT